MIAAFWAIIGQVMHSVWSLRNTVGVVVLQYGQLPVQVVSTLE